jgi:hypothetical protein
MLVLALEGGGRADGEDFTDMVELLLRDDEGR